MALKKLYEAESVSETIERGGTGERQWSDHDEKLFQICFTQEGLLPDADGESSIGLELGSLVATFTVLWKED